MTFTLTDMYEIKLIRSVLEEGAMVKVTTAKDVVDYVEKHCMPKEEQWREQAWVLTLNRGNNINGHFLLSIGGTGSTVFDKKIVAKVAVDMVADGVILVHNHPSGNSKPSTADINQTKDVRNGLKCLDIELLDHVIIADGEFYSFAEEQVTKR